MSLPSDLLNFRMQVVLERLGKKVTNPLRFREELGSACPTDEEILAEDQAYLNELEVAEQAKEVQRLQEAAYSAWVEQGFDTGLGYKLRVADGDQVAFSKLSSSLMLKNPADNFEVKIEAMDGTIKTLTYLQFKTLMIAYGDYCYAAWKAAKGIQ